MDWKNQLYFGDNLAILRQYVAGSLGSTKILLPERRVETFAKAECKTKHAQEELF